MDFRQNNIYISAFIFKKPKQYFYLSLFGAQLDKTKPRGKRGEANYYLCKILELLVQNNTLTEKNDIKLLAGNLDDDPIHNQKKLNKYYEGLGFKKYVDKDVDKEDGQPFKQSIGGFLKNCKKFEPI